MVRNLNLALFKYMQNSYDTVIIVIWQNSKGQCVILYRSLIVKPDPASQIHNYKEPYSV